MIKQTWFTKPKIIKYIPKDKVILFIDESGNSSRKNIENSLNSGRKGCSIRDDVYMLNGIIMDGIEHVILTKKFNKIKKKITNNGLYNYPKKGIRPINLHNVEIEGHKKPFYDLYEDFGYDMNQIMLKTKFIQISAGLNYYIYGVSKPHVAFDSMIMSLGVIIHQYASYLNSIGKEGIIVFETENQVDDMKKLSYVKKVLKRGTNKNSCDFYSKITAVYFRPKWAFVKGEWKTCAGLELADLSISPIRRLYHPEFIVIENKMYGYPNYGRDSINILK